MNNEEWHTYDAWFSLGRQVKKGAKGKTQERKTRQGRVFYETIFHFDDTEDALEQVIECPTSRRDRKKVADLKALEKRYIATFVTEREREEYRKYVREVLNPKWGVGKKKDGTR